MKADRNGAKTESTTNTETNTIRVALSVARP
jgi:hypothetical protein